MIRGTCVLAFVAGCAGGAHGPTTPGDHGGKRGIEAAGLPYQVLDERTGHQLDETAFWDRLASEKVVCVGEEHTNPHHHWVQLQVVEHLAPRWKQFAVGMEMFQRPFQGVLDDYAAGRIDAATLRARSGYADRWGYDYGFYGPTIDAAVAAHGALLALNAPRELTKKVVHHGLSSLTPAERAQLPAEIDLHDAAHRAWFDALMEEMGGAQAHTHVDAKAGEGKDAKAGEGKDAKAGEGKDAKAGEGKDAKAGEGKDAKAGEGKDAKAGDAAHPAMPSADRIYEVQVIWDVTMADGAVQWLKAHPDGHVVILAGGGHCHDTGIVGRIKRRGISDVVSIRTVIDDGQSTVSDALAQPINDFLFVLEPPDDVKAKMRAAEASE